MMIGIFCSALSLAAPLTPEGGLGATFGHGAQGQGPWFGASLTGAVAWEHFGLELDLRGGPIPSTGAATALVRPRFVAPLAVIRTVGLGVLASSGMQLGAPHRAVVSAGLSARTGMDTTLWPRFDLEYLWQPGGLPWQVVGTIGFVSRRPLRPVAPSMRAASPPRLPDADAMVWVPAPVCSWLEPVPAGQAFAAAAATLTPAIVNAQTVRDPSADPFTHRAQGQDGTLVVAAWPGDLAMVGGAALLLDGDGIASLSLPEGDAVVSVIGGGRRQDIDVVMAPDSTLWVTASAPSVVLVPFSGGSSALSSEAKAKIAEIALAAGGWRLSIAGGHSAEGDALFNQNLASKRAEVVYQALLAAGVPPEQLLTTAPRAVDASAPPESQRVVLVTPEAP